MKYRAFKFDHAQTEFLRKVSDFLRYTFTPTFGLMMLVTSLSGVGIMAVLLYRFQPLVAVVIVCSYTTIFLAAMVLSFLRWNRYRGFYKEVFNK